MQRVSVLRRALRDMRWQVFWYGVGFALMVALVVYIYPSYRDQLADFKIPEAFQAFLGENTDYASPQGYFSAEVFSWIPILFVIFAIMQGTNLVGGEEANGTMDILLAQPIDRRSLLLQKLAAFFVGSFAIVVLLCAGWVISLPFVDIDLAFGKFLLASFNVLPLILVFGTLGLWLSVALPSRQQASGVTTAVAVVTFVLNYLATLVDVMKPFRLVSPFYYANLSNVLSSGIDWAKMAVLILLIAAFVILALRAFERRDIGVRADASLFVWHRRRPVVA